MKGFGRWNSGTVFALQWPDGSLKTLPLEPSKLLKKSRLEVRVTFHRQTAHLVQPCLVCWDTPPAFKPPSSGTG